MIDNKTLRDNLYVHLIPGNMYWIFYKDSGKVVYQNATFLRVNYHKLDSFLGLEFMTEDAHIGIPAKSFEDTYTIAKSEDYI